MMRQALRGADGVRFVADDGRDKNGRIRLGDRQLDKHWGAHRFTLISINKQKSTNIYM